MRELSGCWPIVGVAGRAVDLARSLADHVVDHREAEDALVAACEAISAREGHPGKFPCILDAISKAGSLEASLRSTDPTCGVVGIVLPPKMFAKDGENHKYPSGVKAFNSAVPRVHATHADFGYLWCRFLSRLLDDGRIKGHAYEVVVSGLDGVLTGLQKLKSGKASGVKYVYMIEETEAAISFQEGPAQLPTSLEDVAPSSESPHRLKYFPSPS